MNDYRGAANVEQIVAVFEARRAKRAADWDRIQRESPGLAQWLRELQARFGRVKLHNFELYPEGGRDPCAPGELGGGDALEPSADGGGGPDAERD